MSISDRTTYHRLHALTLLCIGAILIAGCATTNETASTPKQPALSLPTVLESVEGIASFYGKKFHGRKTANGERYNQDLFSAAHRRYPFGTILRVTRLETGKAILVRVNDRGPYHKERIIDLSYAAAKELSFVRRGTVNVKVDVLSWGDGRRD